jgi:hypothetical protein
MNQFKKFVLHMETGIDTITGSSLLIHAVMVGATVASYGNIEAYLLRGHANSLTAHTLATVLGASLVVASSRLTKLNLARLRTDRNMQIVVAVAVLTGVLSGILQTAEYMHNTYSWISAAALGFGVPLLLEVAPALTVALLKNVDEGERTDRLRQDMATKITSAISTALDGIRPDDMREEIEEASKVFVHQFVDGTLGDMLYQLRETNQHALSDMLSDKNDSATTMSQPVTPLAQPVTEVMTAKDRREKLYDMIPDGTPSGSIDHVSIAEAFGVTTRTIYRDIESLSKEGRWHVNGVVEKLEG